MQFYQGTSPFARLRQGGIYPVVEEDGRNVFDKILIRFVYCSLTRKTIATITITCVSYIATLNILEFFRENI